MTPTVRGPCCPLCGSADSARRFAVKGYDVRACSGCELLFIDPYPADEAEVHQKVRRYDFEGMEVLAAEKHYRTEIQYYRLHGERIEKDLRDGMAILDVGCGTGHLLERLSRLANARRVGIELNPGRAALARQKAGCPIHEVPVEEFCADERFDAVLMINVLSHIPSFERLFRALGRLLRPGGLLVLKVGEMDRSIRPKDIFDWGLPDHKHFLGLRTAECIAARYGFRIARHERIPVSREMFSREAWKAPGRSRLRNFIKGVGWRIPFALDALRAAYDLTHGVRMFSSLIVMVREDSTEAPGARA